MFATTANIYLPALYAEAFLLEYASENSRLPPSLVLYTTSLDFTRFGSGLLTPLWAVWSSHGQFHE